ncbi:hypothetical protein ACLMJK_002261 [Lecanora helva]
MADAESQQRELQQQQPNLHLSPEERRLFGQLFSAADTDKIGVITGEVAVKFFEKTRLAPDVLGEIWQIADTENRGLLTPAGFGIVLRLIGYAQAGRAVSSELAMKPGGPLPKFDGITSSSAPPPGPPSGPPPGAAQPLQAQSSGGPIRVPPLTPDKVAQYSSLFEESGAQNGILTGDTAKQIFERAQLPNEVLGRIWNLADRDQKGQLGLTEFVIAMHLLASYKNGSLRALPQILPAGLYEAAARRGIPRQVTGSRPTPDGMSPSAIPRQFTGTGYQGQVPPSRGNTMVPQQAPAAGDQWAVSAQDKAQFDQIYATVDTQNRGFITGEQAVGFFSNSRLPEEALAQIWDLADINSEGQLNRDEFAVAMYLIRQQRSKKDGRDVLPQALPPNLIPPSMRRQTIAPQQPTAPAFDNAANITAPKSASDDLFGLDAFSSPSPPSTAPLQAKTTGDSNYAATPPRTQASPPPPQQPYQQSSHFKPFVPSSSFGQAMMTPQSTGTASTSSPTTQNRGLPSQKGHASAADDLLGDNDPEVSKRLTNETSELANLSNQVSTLGGQMQEVTNKRGSTEQTLSQTQSQKRDFEGRLGQLRSAYEQEVREVQGLEERLKASRNETSKLQQDIAMIQGTHQSLQNERNQIAEALAVDQQENSNLKERIRQTNAEIAQIKPQLEKTRSDARQQKGLVAINKKQLATNEQELEKIKAELAESAKEHEEAKRDLAQSQRDIDAASKAVSEARSPPAAVASPPTAIASPSASSASMNPFFRQSSNAAGTEKGISSPSVQHNVSSPNHNAFDNFFGPSLGSPDHPAGPPPATSFGSQPSTSRDIPQEQLASQTSSEGPSVSTPSASPPPSNFSDSPQATGEPPAPPQSRQITSSFLPLRPNVERSGSESSSVKVVPPASRMGDRPGQEGGHLRQMSLNESPIPESPKQHFEEMASKAPQVEARQSTPLSMSDRSNNHPEATMPNEGQSSAIPSAAHEVPGAFPGDETPDSTTHQSTPYSSKLDPRVDSKPKAPANRVKNQSSIDDDKTPSPAATKYDFDSAFAGFDKGKAPEQTNGNLPQAPASQSEFPPIQEFGGDDESESEDDRGFDDEFTPHSANRTTESGPNQALQSPPTRIEGLAPARPPFNTMDTNNTQLPTPGAQSSPPTYDQTVKSPVQNHGDRKGSNQFPAEYSGLLPSRDDPTSPTSPPSHPFDQPSNVGSAAGIDRGINFFGGENLEPQASHASASSVFSKEHMPMSPGASTTAPYAYTQSPPPAQPSQPSAPAVPAKAPVHDDFDDDFADLENAKEESDHGDTDFTPSHRKDFDEFDPTFDSPSASRHTAQSSTTLPASDSFADFESSISGSTSGQQQGRAQPSTTTETPSHDWDAIFAGLDTPQQNNGVQGGDLGPRDFSSSIGQKQAVQGASKGAGKPSLNRVLSDDTEQDDPILKRLTGMGYPRKESLQALEKFDYNLDKVGGSSFLS